jgi:hypothetical protein
MSWLAWGTALVAAAYGSFATLDARSARARELVAPTAVAEPVHAEEARSEAPDRQTWKRITLGRYRGVQALREALDKARVRVGDLADEILGRPAFAFSATPIAIDLVVLTPADLGFTGEATWAEIDRRAAQFGLELCPAEVGPLLRLAYLEQPVGEFLRIAMKPVATWSGTQVDLTVANGGTGPILIGGETRPDLGFTPTAKFVFTRPQRLASP